MRKLACTGWLLLSLLLLFGCEETGGAQAAKLVREKNAPRVAELVLEDVARHKRGLQRAADRIAAGFVRVQGEQQEKEMRQVLRLIRNPKRGIQELVISPMSFMAVVGMDGKAIARDAEPDHMKGMDLAKDFPVVKAALKGTLGMAIGQFENPNKEGKPSITVLMAAPSRYRGKVVGAMVLGIPLWRFSQRLSKQLQMELAGKKGVVIWAYVYRGDELYHHGTPRDLDKLVVDGAGRREGLARSPGGFTGTVQQFGFWYGFGVRPLRVLGDDVGVIVYRMDPQ